MSQRPHFPVLENVLVLLLLFGCFGYCLHTQNLSGTAVFGGLSGLMVGLLVGLGAGRVMEKHAQERKQKDAQNEKETGR